MPRVLGRRLLAVVFVTSVCACARAKAETPPSAVTLPVPYRDAIRNCIRRHLRFRVPAETLASIYAEFEVQLLPTGEQAAAPRLTKESGIPGYDAAAHQAISRCNPFPHDADGSLPRHFHLRMFPVDLPPTQGTQGV